MITDTTCVILSGGKNKRMGSNKALLKINNKTIIEIIHEKVRRLFNNVILISNEPELYKFLEVKIYKDIFPGKGPISGIHSGLVNSTTAKNFFISCDMPLVKNELIEYLVKYKTEKSIVLPMSSEYVQTLCGIYEKKTIPYIEEKFNRVDNGIEEGKEKQSRFSMISLATEIGAEFIEINILPFYDDKMFFNLNNLDDFEEIKKLIGNRIES